MRDVGNRWHTGDTPITTKVVWDACKKAAQRAGLQKDVHPHTLRHITRNGMFDALLDLRLLQRGRWARTEVAGRLSGVAPRACHARTDHMRFGGFMFGSIHIEGVTYEHDMLIDRGDPKDQTALYRLIQA